MPPQVSARIRQTVRKWLYLSHLWIGIILGLYFTLLGLTGSALIFKTELNNYFDPAAHHLVVPAGSARASIDDIVRNFKQAHPQEKILSVILPEAPNETISVVYRPERESAAEAGPRAAKPDARQCFFNPFTAQLITERVAGGDFFNTVKKLHTRLLLDDLGRDLNRYGVLFILVLLLSGLWLWCPSLTGGLENFRRQFKTRTSIKLDGKLKRIVFDTHNTVGFYSSALLLLFALTAITALWRDQSAVILSTLTQSTVVSEKKARPSAKPVLYSFDRAVARAESALPGCVAVLVSGDLQVTVARPQSHFFYPRLNTVTFDREDGRLISIEQPEAKSPGQLILNSAMPVHYGQWGPGFAYNLVKGLWVLAGLCPSVLCLTGFMMYLEKEKTKRERVAKKVIARQSAVSP